MSKISEQKQTLQKEARNAERTIEDIRIFALDMDGTIYLGDKWIDGAPAFLRSVIETGREYFFLTNNSSKSPSAYVEKLRRMGFETTPEHIITSGQATIWYLQKHYPGKRVFLLGNDLLREEFAEAGMELTASGEWEPQDNIPSKTDPVSWEEAELVVTGFDTTLTYAKMCQVCDLVRRGLPYVATHPDYNCPTEDGFIPDIGAISAFIKASTGREPDVVVGKPYAPMAEYLLERARNFVNNRVHAQTEVNLSGQTEAAGEKQILPVFRGQIEYRDIAMVGDRLYTDVACGVRAGMTGILVLSGEAMLEDVRQSDVIPDLIFNSVKEICL